MDGKLIQRLAQTITNNQGGYPEVMKALTDFANGILAFPVGAIYTSITGVDPATELGYGTWSAWGAGRVPVGVDTNDANFNTVEKTGGESVHTLTTSEIPGHTHGWGNWSGGVNNNHTHTTGSYTSNNEASGYGLTKVSGFADRVMINGGSVQTGTISLDHQHYTSGTTDTGTAYGGSHNNIQQYITCYMWKRVS